MANNCNKLIKEALDSFLGIEFRYKLDDTLEGLGSQKFTTKQLEGYLLGKGVSPKEIKQSGIFEGMIDDNRALPADMWLNKSGKQSINTFRVAPDDWADEAGYETVTLGRKGVGNETYKETLSIVKKPRNNAPSTPHFENEISTPKESLLGWRRTHIDEINGKKTLVLNEFQSDWAQTERAGRGIFESNMPSKNQVIEAENLVRNYLKDNNININDVIQGKVKLPPDIAKADKLVENYDKNKVADFPMSEVKHHQFQIVGAINDAIKEGIDTVAIPIQRENELMGGPGVTKFYESLNTKVLPDIRKKLEKQGLKIKVDKKPYKAITISKQEQDKIVLEAYNKLNTEARGYLDWSELEGKATLYDKLVTIDNTNNSFSNSVDFGEDFYKLYNQGVDNDLWTLTIEEVPNGKVKWDVYALLSSLGLVGAISQSEANTMATEKDIAPRQTSIETDQIQQAIPEDKLDLASFLSDVPEEVKPSNYKSNYKGIKDYIAKIESRGESNPYNAKNPNSSAKGKYQFTNIMVKDLNQKLGITRQDLKSPKVQEQAMEYLIGEYKEALDKWELPNTKENIFVLHNLGVTGGVKALRGTYEPSDIKNMASNLPKDMDKSSRNAVITNYNTLYNVDIPLRSKRISKS